MRDYCTLHTHSEYSNIKIIDSINRFERSVDYAWELGLSGICMTEHDCLSGTLQALDIYKKKLKDEWSKKYPESEFPGFEAASSNLDFKVLLGNEIYLTEEGLNEAMMDGNHPVHFWHLIFPAFQDDMWVQLLHQISSFSDTAYH